MRAALAHPMTGEHWIQRAQPLLGTMVSIRVGQAEDKAEQGNQDGDGFAGRSRRAMNAAFEVIGQVGLAMSAHLPDSDLARLCRAVPGQETEVNGHTVQVLRLAKYWHQATLGAFDPVGAANRLHIAGLRPAFDGIRIDPQATLRDVHCVADDQVVLSRPLRLDLGGIAKGYAVDLAIQAVVAQGVEHALVNAGGDMRATGDWCWPVVLRDPCRPGRMSRATGLRGIRNEALATSTAGVVNPEFVPTVRRASTFAYTRCTVRAPDCVTADVLTKWGLQALTDSPRMMRVFRKHGASMWRI